MYNILVTGANGQLGSEIRELETSYPQHHFFFTDLATLDITDKKAIDLFIRENKITAIINCAAYTAVDKAESEPKLADKINRLAVQYLAEAAKVYDCKFIHISTDYVFDGTNHKPYTETDKPNPQSVYGSTKLAGELALQKIDPCNSIIIRTSWVYSSFGNNFVKTMLRLGNEKEELGVIFDQIGTPTFAGDLAKVILEILPKIKNEEVEIFHYTNEGVCSWYDFAKAIFEFTNINCSVKPISTAQYPTAAARPHYSLLDKSKIKENFNVDIPYWKGSLKICLQKIKSEQKL
ncbi:MAG: dTDP-4-dehydrorhamnose reductase [Lutibacter sp.]|nr:dTDP-4-dehydrorhamnose reductase [Lutibacter sp.]